VVFVADCGETVLNALDGAMFDLMIVDIFMRRMRGF
jgi:CheY-like chemotaxis protein